MSGFFDEPPAPRRPAAPTPPPQRSRALIGTAVILVAAFFLISIFTNIWTDRLWFNSLGYSSVFTKVLGTRVLLFVVFGLLLGAVVAANIVIAFKVRPMFRPASQEQVSLDRYREVVEPLRRWVLIGIALVLALFAGQLRRRPVAPVPAVAAPRAVRHQGPLLQQGRRVLRLRAAVAALPRGLRDGGQRARA